MCVFMCVCVCIGFGVLLSFTHTHTGESMDCLQSAHMLSCIFNDDVVRYQALEKLFKFNVQCHH